MTTTTKQRIGPADKDPTSGKPPKKATTARSPEDLARELLKIRDAVQGANVHFYHEARMNAALHMSADVRPAPLAAAIRSAVTDLDRLIMELNGDIPF